MKLSLYYPVKPLHINQPFGNPDPKYSALGLNGHNGIDLMAYHGQPVYASHDGLASYEIDSDSGHGVVLRTNDTFDFGAGGQAYYKTIYWHLCDSSKEPQYRSPVEGTNGLQVKAGDLIGYADNTGLSTGNHLHWGLKPQYLASEPPGSWYNADQNNGYLGAIDPTPYFNGLYAEDLKPKYLFTKDFGFLSVGSDVRALQAKLGVLQTGFFFTATRAAVKGYQVAHNIPATGFVGPLTRAQLNT